MACQQQGPNAADATKPGPEKVEAPAPAEPWRFGPALATSVPAGTVAEPVLEVADGLRGRARIVVAVAEGTSPARLEIWDFSQNNPRERLERVDAPVVLLDLDPSAAVAPAEALAQLRREMASPASESGRAVGLAAEEPGPMLAELARLAATATSAGEGRATALARFTRGLDDRLLWSEQFPELLRRLGRGPWSVGTVTPLGARRMRVAAREGERTLQLELTRTQDRWVLTDVVEATP